MQVSPLFSGEVFVKTVDLDREMKSFYIYIVEAEDGAPTGRRGAETVQGQPNRSKTRRHARGGALNDAFSYSLEEDIYYIGNEYIPKM